MIREVMELASNLAIDYICIESTGISEPMPVALAFCQEDVVSGRSLAQVTRLDTMLTVVDLAQFDALFASRTRVGDEGWQQRDTDVRTLSELLVDQIEFANVSKSVVNSVICVVGDCIV